VTLNDYFHGGPEMDQVVIFENDFVGNVPILGREFSVPTVLKDVHGMPLFSAGRKNTGVGMHRHNENWLAQADQ